MPETDGVTRARAASMDRILRPGRPRAMELPGFDPEFGDIVEYILRITYRIWEQQSPERVREYYAPDCVIHTLAGPIAGVDRVVDNTAATLVAFPDRRLFGDDVVWSHDGPDGFYTSHRITSPMTHLGAGHWGEPTGRFARIRTIADCLVRDNRIYEEWLMRDGLSMALQLGLDPAVLARRSAEEARANAPLQQWIAGEVARLTGGDGAGSAKPENAAEAFAADLFYRLWNEGDPGVVRRAYSPGCALHGPSGRELFGHEEIAHHAALLRDGLTDVAFSVDHLASIHQDDAPGCGLETVALRWSLTGRYERPGLYGPPTGARLYYLGSTHLDVCEGRVVEEWTVFDELAILAQVAGAIAETS